MSKLIDTVGKAIQPVRKLKSVEDVLSPYSKVVTDLVALKEEREDLINKATVRRMELHNQIDALNAAIDLHRFEIEEANAAIQNFSELLA